jgi:hypothetical protein
MTSQVKLQPDSLADTPAALNDSMTLQLTLRLSLRLMNQLQMEADEGGFRSVQQLIKAVLEKRAELRATLPK